MAVTTPVITENESLGALLDSKYGEGKSQDLHINYFYLILGNEIVANRAEILALLQTVGEWGNLETEWPGYLVGTFPLYESERAQEEELNKLVRIPLLQMLYGPTPLKHAILISRVCKYTSIVEAKNELTTGDIEKVLVNPLDQHLDYFYLTIKVERLQVNDTFMALSHFLNGWKMVAPGKAWPLTFIGYVPKKPFESEREREWRINKDIRMPLKYFLNKELKKTAPAIPDDEKVVIVLFSRACKYTEM